MVLSLLAENRCGPHSARAVTEAQWLVQGVEMQPGSTALPTHVLTVSSAVMQRGLSPCMLQVSPPGVCTSLPLSTRLNFFTRQSYRLSCERAGRAAHVNSRRGRGSWALFVRVCRSWRHVRSR